MTRILPGFSRHKEAGRIIGEIVAGYGELEILLAWACAWLHGDEDVVFKVMFRAPGEKQRVLMADAMVRGGLSPGKVRTRFEQAIAGMHQCRKIRNQYAHCTWGDDARGLWFVNLEEIAESDETFDLWSLTQHVIDIDLLREQEAYFCHIKDCLQWLTFEGQKAQGHIPTNHWPDRRHRKPPKLHP